MSLNCLEIDKILDELPLRGAFIQNVVQPSFDALAFYLYAGAKADRPAVPFTLFICLAHGACRLHSFSARVPKYEKPLRFMEFLRSNLKGARIDSAVQLGCDRIVKFSLSKGGERFFMYVRLWSGAANVIVTDSAGKILDVFYRRPKRGEVSGALCEYAEIGVQTESERHAESEAQTQAEAQAQIERHAESGAQTQSERHAESEARHPAFSKEPPAGLRARDFESLLKEIQGESGADAGSVCAGAEGSSGDGAELPASRARAWRYNAAVEAWYATKARAFSRTALLDEARKRFTAKAAKLERSLEKLRAKRADFWNADRLRRQGDLLTANLWAVKPGDTFIEVEDYEAETPGARVRIPLNPRLSPQENAAAFYSGYKKAVSGLEDLSADIRAAEENLAALKKQLAELEREQNPLVIQKKLRAQSRSAEGGEKRFPGPVFRCNDWLLLVGRSAAENDELLRRFVKGSDMWLHARDWPGGYVFIKNRPGKTVPLEILLDAGTLAVFYSKGRNNGAGDVYCTQVKYLRRAKGAPKGTVLPSHEKNLFIKLEPARLKRLELCRED